MGRTDSRAGDVVTRERGVLVVGAILEHHGVKGMKWGKRKAGTGPASTHVKRSNPHEDHTKVSSLRKEKTKTLSNDEIQKINKRLQLERSYSELAAQTSVISKGQKKAAVVLGLAATATSIYTFAQSPLGKSIRKGVVTGLKQAAKAGAASA